ncbi:SAM-dependent methyltransferase [Acrocarpospora sp. B8E8]|uniref:SAM-dependent methyltransferase n=1 Tax=Acrocarpospora sp. B8E8 TaxID=3153572 RepID=UPI00325E81C2
MEHASTGGQALPGIPLDIEALSRRRDRAGRVSAITARTTPRSVDPGVAVPEPPVLPGDMDPKTPNVARMYDYYLGGKDNFATDRECADEVIRRVPQAREIAWANRRFLGRAVRFLADELGIDQFVDVGAGLPTRENVHQVAQRVNPDARVVYVDNDPVVQAHAQALLATDDQTRAITGDVRDPRGILADERLRGLLDLERPVGLLLVAVLHFITPEENPYESVTELLAALPRGSALVISHVERDESLAGAVTAYRRASSPAVLRSVAEVARFFGGLDVVEPGVVRVRDWRPDDLVLRFDPDVPILGAVGVKR